MTNLFSTSAKLIASLLIASASFGQTTAWMPIPYQQTNLYTTNLSDEIIPMKCDWWSPGGTGDFYGIYEQFIQDEFDTCAQAIWDPAYTYSYPRTDFRTYVDQVGDVIVLQGQEQYFGIPLSIDTGTWGYYGNDLLIKFIGASLSPILGSIDSVMTYEVYHNDSATLIGEITISKQFGLVEYPTVQSLEKYPSSQPEIWTLVGTEGPSDVSGSNLPDRIDLLPYHVGDELVFYNTYYENWTTEVEEYHHLTIEEVSQDSNNAYLKGVCHVYDHQGFYLETDSQYIIDFEPLVSEIVDKANSVRFLSSGFHGNYGWMRFYNTNDSGLVAVLDANTSSYCDTVEIVDGFATTVHFSIHYGMLRRLYHGFQPPQLLELMAADAMTFEYGTWPTWLNAEQVESPISLHIYPNPATESVWMETNVPERFEVYTIGGAKVDEWSVNGKTNIHVDHLSPGMYLVKGISTITKLVVTD